MRRRDVLQLLAVAACGSAKREEPRAAEQIAPPVIPDAAPAASPPKATMNTRKIPKSGEAIPMIGMGTWQTFDVTPDKRATLDEVMTTFLAAGGRLIDSSPMYGRAEQTTGDVLKALGQEGTPFRATKVWTRGKREGIEQMARSRERMGGKPIDLMQVHNLLDVETHLPVLREMKQAKQIRYLGVTHYSMGEFGAIEKLMRTGSLDFIQIPYNIMRRDAEKRILPAAIETGTAVLVMRPFEEGTLFESVKGKALPAWASEFDCSSWAQFFLKFLLGHPAITCPIPATSKVKHAADNVLAGYGRLPDEAMRTKMIAAI
jgi:aryl-alcohol dehydrogenase-like predicted oxidoreductase